MSLSSDGAVFRGGLRGEGAEGDGMGGEGLLV